MAETIHLHKHHIRLFRGLLCNHDYLFFASQDVDGLAITYPVIHNYALSYAVSNRSYGISSGGVPRYVLDREEELLSLPVYCTPALPLSPPRAITMTMHAQDSLRYSLAPTFNRNTPTLQRAEVLDVCYARDPQAEGKGFEFFAFLLDPFYRPPSVFRLGKKRAPVRVAWEPVEKPVARLHADPITASHAVNPLDVRGELESYQPLDMRPHLLLKQASISNDWFISYKDPSHQWHWVHLPKLLDGLIMG